MNEMMHCYWDSCCWGSWRLRGRRTWYCGSEGLLCKLRQTYWGARAHLGSCQDFWPGGVIFLFAKMRFFSITILLRKKVLKISIFLVNTYRLVEMIFPESVIRKKISGGKWRDWGILWLNFFLFAHLCSDELTWILNTFAHLFTPLLIQWTFLSSCCELDITLTVESSERKAYSIHYSVIIHVQSGIRQWGARDGAWASCRKLQWRTCSQRVATLCMGRFMPITRSEAEKGCLTKRRSCPRLPEVLVVNTTEIQQVKCYPLLDIQRNAKVKSVRWRIRSWNLSRPTMGHHLLREME